MAQIIGPHRRAGTGYPGPALALFVGFAAGFGLRSVPVQATAMGQALVGMGAGVALGLMLRWSAAQGADGRPSWRVVSVSSALGGLASMWEPGQQQLDVQPERVVAALVCILSAALAARWKSAGKRPDARE